MSGRTLRRRDLLASGLALSGAAALLALARGRESGLALAAARLAGAAAEVGRRYLERHPAEANRDVLAALVTPRLEREVGSLPERMAAAAREDFRRARVVSVDGWRLSRTEARICALAHLAVVRGA